MLASCSEEYFDTKPTTSLDPSIVFKTTKTSYMALNGIWRSMWQQSGNSSEAGQKSVDMTMDLMGEDLFPNEYGYGWFVADYNYTDARNTQGARPLFIWSYYYDLINNANLIMKFVPAASGPATEKNDLIGQAFAIRAFSHFGIVQAYAKTYKGNEAELGIPIYTEHTTVGKERAKIGDVYKQIVADLDSAITRLSKGVNRPDKSFISQKVAKGFRARVALVMEDWTNAAKYANEARAGYQPMDAETCLKGFSSIENAEWMWGSTINDEQSTIYSSFFSHIDPFAGGYASLGCQKLINQYVYDAMSDKDVRKQMYDADGSLTGKVLCGFKFYLPANGWKGDQVYMRAAEMYLIEAEALARLGRDSEAAGILKDLVETRDASYVASSSTGQALVNEIWMQRRIELWGEGFRLLDIKRQKVALNRTGSNHNLTLAVKSQIPAESKYFELLIPQQEMNSNPKMVQNPL